MWRRIWAAIWQPQPGPRGHLTDEQKRWLAHYEQVAYEHDSAYSHMCPIHHKQDCNARMEARHYLIHTWIPLEAPKYSRLEGWKLKP